MATIAAERAKPRRRIVREANLDSPDPIDIAMAAAASGKHLPDVARRVLEEQVHLIHAQCGELKLRKIGEGVRAALWAILAIAAAGIVALMIAIVIRASRSDALVVQSFRVPPALAARGLTGEVVATQVLDKLAEMQASSESARAASSYANNWEDELKIDIPNTGANTDQMWKLLRGWLGKETLISGEIIETKSGLALTSRVGSKPGQRFISQTGDLDTLVAQGAELIFRNTQPYRYAVSLRGDQARFAERVALLQQLTHDASPMERKWAFNGLSVTQRQKGNFPASIVAARQALAIDGQMLPALGNLAASHYSLGHDQMAVDLIARQHTLPISDEYDAQITAANHCDERAQWGAMTRNPRLVGQTLSCMESAPQSYQAYMSEWRLQAAVARHEVGAILALRQPISKDVAAEEAARVNSDFQLRGEILRGRTPALARAVEQYAMAMALRSSTGSGAVYYAASAPTQEWPLQAEALSILGRHGEAGALIAKTPLDCYTCLRVRGLVARAAGDPRAAQRWFAEAARQGPRLAPAFADWGRLLAEHRRFDSAEVKLAEAARLAPNWADPLKYWGDSLAAQGKARDALAKYDAALKLAPRWAELRLARNRLSRT